MSTITAIQNASPFALAEPSIRGANRPGLSAMLVLAADVVGLRVTLWAFLGNDMIGRYASPGDWLLLWPLVPLFLVLYWSFDLYPGVSVSAIDEMRRIFLATASGFIFVFAILALHQVALKPGIVCLPASICGTALVLALRAAIRRVGSRFNWWGHPVVLFGCGDSALSMLRKLKSQPHLGLRPVAVVSDQSLDVEIEGTPIFRLEHLSWIASGVTHAILAAPELSRSEFTEVVARGCDAFPHFIIIPDTDSMSKLGSYAQDLSGTLGIRLGNNLLKRGPQVVKRIMDLGCSLALALFLLPLMTLISLLVSVDSGFPVFYSQKRLGRGGRTFRIWKFRTMVKNSAKVLDHYLANNPEAKKEWSTAQKLRKDPRITALGKVLRKASLDELPQLWNVLKGEMSLVGPRPIVNSEVDKYKEHYAVYIKTTPGITGLWQVSGRNQTTYEERVALDTFYVRNWSVWMDIYLLVKTVGVVLTAHGAY